MATKYLFTVSEYQRMGDAGIIPPDARTELINGEIIEMSPIGSAHAWCVTRLIDLLTTPQLKAVSILGVQNPIQLGDHSNPQPDLTLIKRQANLSRDQHPTPKDILLVIEVSDTTVQYDRTVKIPLYAQEGIPEMWLIDLPADAIDVCSNPVDGQYQTIQHLKRGDTLTSPTIPDLVLKVEDVLG